MASSRKEAFRIITETRPTQTHRAALVGCGRMGSTIDDEHVGKPHYPWPWAHAPAIIEARNIELVAAVDVDQRKLEDFQSRWGYPKTPRATIGSVLIFKAALTGGAPFGTLTS